MAKTRTRKRRGLVDPSSPSAEPFRTLRLALHLGSQSGNGRGGHAIVVTSALAEEGKSTIAANYAVISGMGQGSVLLIDGDLRQPTLHEFFGVPRSPGLVEMLADGSDLSAFVHRVSTFGAVDLLPAGRSLPHSADLASSPRMAELIRQAQQRYTQVVIDAPPVLGAANAEALSAHEGVSVVMVATRKGKRRPLVDALRRLELVDADVAGIVLNRTGAPARYGY